MATHTVRKVSHSGIGYSIVELNDVRHVFAAAVPRRGNTLREQADDALGTIAAVIGEHGARGSIECRRGLRAALERLSPAHWDVVQLDVDGNHYPEIAKRLQIPLGTVCSRLHRAPNYGKNSPSTFRSRPT